MLPSEYESPLSSQQLMRIARLGALALFLSTIEYMIPKPVPFMRLGLANVPIMLSLQMLPFSGYVVLVLLKVIGQALVNGTLFSYIALFSLFGTAASSLVMYAIYRAGRHHVSFIGISTAGALASNGVQLVLSRYIIFGPSAWLIAPPFLIMGLITSVILGVFTEVFVHKSAWYAQQRADVQNLDDSTVLPPVSSGASLDLRLLTGFAVLPALLFQQQLIGTVVIAALAVAAALAHGKRFRLLPNLLLIVSVTLANLMQKNGLVLTEIFGYPITAGALELGLKKACTLIGMIYLSQYMVSARPSLPGPIGMLVSRQLYYFERITELWKGSGSTGVIARIDELLFSLDAIEETQQESSAAHHVLLQPLWSLLLISISWGVFAAGLYL